MRMSAETKMKKVLLALPGKAPELAVKTQLSVRWIRFLLKSLFAAGTIRRDERGVYRWE